MREAGIVLKSIELTLMLGSEEKAGGKLSIVLLSAEAARRSEVSFTQTFLLEIPGSPQRQAVPGPLVPGVREFVETAMEAARDIALVAAAEGLPQRLRQVVLFAALERSRKRAGEIAFTLPTATPIIVGAGADRTSREQNTIKLVFAAAP